MLSKTNNDGIVFASGDDILCFTRKPVHKTNLYYIGREGSGLGLGQKPTDFIYGSLYKQSFLSRSFSWSAN